MRFSFRSLLIASALLVSGGLALFLLPHGHPNVEHVENAVVPANIQHSPPAVIAEPTGAAAPSAADDLLHKAVDLPESATPRERLELSKALADLGAGSEKQLAVALGKAKSKAAKAALADALGRIGTSEAVDALLANAASEHNDELRDLIIRAFDALPPGQPIETLVSSLVTPQDSRIRDGIIATASRAADSETVKFLGELYREPVAYPGQTEAIISALGSIRNAEAVPSLSTMLRESGNLSLMEAASRSLAKIGTPPALQSLADALDRVGATNPAFRELILQSLQAVDSAESLPWLEQAARGKTDDGLAKAASVALGRLKVKS